MNLQRTVFGRLYRRADRVEDLAWHREEPPPLLVRAVEAQGGGGGSGARRALDLGCGEGVYATWLARQGYSVVGIDFVAAALDAARARASAAGVGDRVSLVEGDVVDHVPDAPYDLVLDSGCLHHLPRSKAPGYRARLDQWLAPGGDYVLVHFAHRPKAGWIPGGPKHLTRDEAVARFAPYELRAHDETSFEVPLPMGTMRAGVHWFTRPA